ncbi:folate receptor beta-like [Pollicipes pollicipes]|uniref:folate receptor beta-like n=1 Tax=Pollicipes pollicipes TaxID=41117 RepID=UPI00188566CE|nr:folate receptor beta-like [Pollicipes pollicipes]
MLVRVALVAAGLSVALCQLTTNLDTMLNWCLDGRHHKTRPGPEDQLHQECTPWRERACCTANTTRHLHTSNLYGFSYDHCPGKRMSAQCRRHFVRDLCFHECSPNIGPWVAKVDMKIRNERFFKVPLCASQCIDWYEDCKHDFTCTDNWSRNFRWKNGTNHCPAGAQCFTFAEVYGNAQRFCETVWDHSWKYTEDDQPCMQIWFQSARGNPNEAVARLHAILHSAAPRTAPVGWLAVLLLLLLAPLL